MFCNELKILFIEGSILKVAATKIPSVTITLSTFLLWINNMKTKIIKEKTESNSKK